MTKKLDKRKNYYLVYDVETTNRNKEDEADKGLVYDLGFRVIDKKGNCYYEKSLVISDIFVDRKDLMQNAYYKEKLPKYYEQIKNGERKLVTFAYAYKLVHTIIKKFNIKQVWAYNSYFDKTTLNNTIREITNNKVWNFFPYNVQINCIWNFACNVLYTQKSFLKQNITNEKGNLITKAERGYQYIKNLPDFIESHTGLEDSRIESELLVKCWQQHKKVVLGINRDCWRIPNIAKRKFAKIN